MKVRIVAAVVDTRRLLLYKDDGKTIVVPQGDPRMQALVNQVLPIVQSGDVAEIDLLDRNEYRAFEEQSGGIVRFFRAAKRFVFGHEEEEPGVLFGNIPEPAEPVEPVEPQLPARTVRAVDEIMKHAEPVTAEDFDATSTSADETIVAVVERDDGSKVAIPGAEMIADLLEHSAKNRNTIGVQNLFKRMAAYAKTRQHSVEDLLRFLEKGDLPIADDGSIIAYKRLYSTNEEGVFVDPHTRKVTQKVGDYVCVAENLVDKDRRNECSNGLHIGRRKYMGSFSGDVLTLCKIAPEDVIVVPHNDPNKVRVCGYHILARLSDDAKQRVLKNRPMTEIKGLPELLGKVLAGDHIGILRRVEITEQRGGGLKITETGKLRKDRRNQVIPAKPAHAIDDKAATPESRVDPKQVAAQITGGRQQRARDLLAVFNKSTFTEHRQKAAVEIVAFKKAAKVSWDKLGIDAVTAQQLTELAKTPVKPVQAKGKPVAPPKPAKAKKASSKAPRPSKPPKNPVIKDDRPHKAETQAPASKPLSKYQQLRQLADQLDTGHLSPAQEAIIAQQLLDARKASKKSWEALGFPDLSDLQLRRIIESPLAAQMPKGNYGKNGDQDRLGAVNEMLADNAKQARDEDALSPERKAALALVRGGMAVSAASRKTGVHRRTIDRDVEKYGK